jgi:hypothetical protein
MSHTFETASSVGTPRWNRECVERIEPGTPTWARHVAVAKCVEGIEPGAPKWRPYNVSEVDTFLDGVNAFSHSKPSGIRFFEVLSKLGFLRPGSETFPLVKRRSSSSHPRQPLTEIIRNGPITMPKRHVLAGVRARHRVGTAFDSMVLGELYSCR